MNLLTLFFWINQKGRNVILRSVLVVSRWSWIDIDWKEIKGGYQTKNSCGFQVITIKWLWERQLLIKINTNIC